MLRHWLDQPPTAEQAGKFIGRRRVSETPADMIPAVPVAPPAAITVLKTALAVEGVHSVQPLPEAAERHGNLDHVRKIAFDGPELRPPFVARHASIPCSGKCTCRYRSCKHSCCAPPSNSMYMSRLASYRAGIGGRVDQFPPEDFLFAVNDAALTCAKNP